GRLSSQNLEGVVTRFIDSNKQAIDLLEKLDFECDCYSRNIPDYVLYVDFRGKLDRDYQHLLQGPICGNNSAKLIIEDVNKKKYKNCGFTHELYETDEFEPVLRLLVQFKEPSQVNVDSLKNLVEYVRKKEYSVAKEDIR
ncbi:hypothetical protein JXA85_09025, partial [Candidatus Woesearchaeota archaeon]|nr:hypothetical protein [Candidatus Woesearchaeota archaeon]